MECCEVDVFSPGVGQLGLQVLWLFGQLWFIRQGLVGSSLWKLRGLGASVGFVVWRPSPRLQLSLTPKALKRCFTTAKGFHSRFASHSIRQIDDLQVHLSRHVQHDPSVVATSESRVFSGRGLA